MCLLLSRLRSPTSKVERHIMVRTHGCCGWSRASKHNQHSNKVHKLLLESTFVVVALGLLSTARKAYKLWARILFLLHFAYFALDGPTYRSSSRAQILSKSPVAAIQQRWSDLCSLHQAIKQWSSLVEGDKASYHWNAAALMKGQNNR